MSVKAERKDYKPQTLQPSIFSFDRQQETIANINSSGISANTSSPIQHVLFLKTHKTGSTTIANIFFRYGDTRDLTFVLGHDTLISAVTAINNYIAFLDKEFDLVMITDYFDESVVLLKRLLRWKLDDILYFKSNERQDKEKAVGLTDQVKDSIKRWNAADDLLFRYFNQTFWQKIETEGESFYDDLEAFRRKKEQLSRLCLTNGTILQRQYSNR